MPKFLILGARSYDFVNQETGERISGVKITYVDQPENDAINKGYTPMSVSADETLWNDLTSVPGIYDFDFGMKATKVGGAPKLVLHSVKLLKEVSLPVSS